MTPCAIQNRKTSRSAAQSERQSAALEVERVDVLILLRRVLRVLDRSVGPMLEPLGVLADPRMIGRRLERDVERDLETEPVRDGDEAIEVVERAEPGLDGRVSAVFGADGPRAARIARRRRQRVVPALAVRAADRMDRRQVEDVEAHRRDVGQPRFGVAQRAAARRVGRARAREHLVPRAEPRANRIDRDAQRAIVGRWRWCDPGALPSAPQLRIARGGDPFGLRCRCAGCRRTRGGRRYLIQPELPGCSRTAAS